LLPFEFFSFFFDEDPFLQNTLGLNRFDLNAIISMESSSLSLDSSFEDWSSSFVVPKAIPFLVELLIHLL